MQNNFGIKSIAYSIIICWRIFCEN